MGAVVGTMNLVNIVAMGYLATTGGVVLSLCVAIQLDPIRVCMMLARLKSGLRDYRNWLNKSVKSKPISIISKVGERIF